MEGQAERTFKANNGRVLGWLGMGAGVVVIGFVLSDGVTTGDAAPVAWTGLAMALLWVIMLRPSLRHRDDDLLLRRSFSDVVIPLVSVEHVMIRSFMVIVTDERKFHSSAFSRRRKEVVHHDRGKVAADPATDYTTLVEIQINQLAENARAQRRPARPTRTTPAWPEIAAVVLLAASVVVLTVL